MSSLSWKANVCAWKFTKVQQACRAGFGQAGKEVGRGQGEWSCVVTFWRTGARPALWRGGSQPCLSCWKSMVWEHSRASRRGRQRRCWGLLHGPWKVHVYWFSESVNRLWHKWRCWCQHCKLVETGWCLYSPYHCNGLANNHVPSTQLHH